MKIGVLVVAYNAERTLAAVLDRIPPAMADRLAEVLVQDDHSGDDTHAVATGYAAASSALPVTVVRHDRNLGYGGNQKTGYRYAIHHGWDVVVLLHGDGQYAPEVMHEIVAPIVDGDADAVFGSRMLRRGQARAGGMPLYKFVGNRVLTRFQNATSGLALSEWHSGYRAYRTAALADIPFAFNSDGFDFDTEIILQLHSAGKRIAEVPIPTYYGDEICYVDGLRYARDVVRHSVRHRLGASGFGAGALARVDEPYAFKPSATSSHGRVLRLLADRPPQRVLDVGCGPGWLAAALTEQGHEVTGVDAAAADGIDGRMHRFVRADLDQGLPDEIGEGFDVVVAADILEHLREPSLLLTSMVDRLRPGGTVIASVPNFSHWYPRSRVALGQFDYDQRGILDATHLRFFTRRSFLRMAAAAGLEPVAPAHTGLPFDALGAGSGRAVRAAAGADRALVRTWPTMFAYQFVFELVPRGHAVTR
ncbi:MAG: bifunctional glycosyltransferase/class I SAM-dependent methyltransferase [Ilumatobacteraceae bacterium]